MHGTKLGTPQGILIGRTSSLQDHVHADLRISSKANTMQEIRSEIAQSNEMKQNEMCSNEMKVAQLEAVLSP